MRRWEREREGGSEGERVRVRRAIMERVIRQGKCLFYDHWLEQIGGSCLETAWEIGLHQPYSLNIILSLYHISQISLFLSQILYLSPISPLTDRNVRRYKVNILLKLLIAICQERPTLSPSPSSYLSLSLSFSLSISLSQFVIAPYTLLITVYAYTVCPSLCVCVYHCNLYIAPYNTTHSVFFVHCI